MAYYVSIVPGQNLMRYQVRDVNWSKVIRQKNGGVALSRTNVFRLHLSLPRSSWSV